MSINRNITETINSALTEAGVSPATYQTYIVRVAEALTEQVKKVGDDVERYAIQQGLPAEQAKHIVVDLGLRDPEPEVQPTATATGEVDLTALAASISEVVSEVRALRQFATRHGFTG